MDRKPRFQRFISRVNLPVKFCLRLEFFPFLSLLLFLLSSGIFSLLADPSLGNNIPRFFLQDQFENSVDSRSLLGKRGILAGCFPEDEEICRKVARKIYWKMQSLTFGKEKDYFFIGYLLLHKTNTKVAETLLPKYRSKGYESVYLDWKGILEKGSRLGWVHLRVVDPNGRVIMENYLDRADNEDVIRLFKKLNP